jgi:hypothetical protein
MTADWAKQPYELFDKISRRIVTRSKEQRVVYDITSKLLEQLSGIVTTNPAMPYYKGFAGFVIIRY